MTKSVGFFTHDHPRLNGESMKWNSTDVPPTNNGSPRAVAVRVDLSDGPSYAEAIYFDGKYWFPCYDPDASERKLLLEKMERVSAWAALWAPNDKEG